MKQKHLQVIKDQHKGYLAKISQPEVKEPDATCHIVHALVRGETVNLLSAAEVSAKAREIVAGCRYGSDRTMSFESVFKAPASFVKAKREFDAAKKQCDQKTATYQNEAEAFLRKCELNDDMEPIEASAELRLLAITHGIDA